MRFCIVTRELAPFGGGGIGVYAAALAALLAEHHEVTVVTTAAHRHRFEALVAGPGSTFPAGVALHFVREPAPAELATYVDFHHAWSGAVLEALEDLYGARGPDLIEFPDYHAEGFVTIQAKRSLHPMLRDTAIAVRVHTTWELCTLLDGCLPDTTPVRALCAMERYALRHADVLLHAGGDILGTYERFYGAGELAPARCVRHPLEPADALPPAEPVAEGTPYPIRFLYFGRLERRKGLLDLVQGFMHNPSATWELTLVGADTPTAPLGVSMLEELELLTAGDERVSIRPPVPREELTTIIAEHDVVVMASPWECWPYTVLEALRVGRPVLATPVGGHLEMVVDGETGWLCDDIGAAALGRGLDRLLDHIESVRALSVSEAARRHVQELSEPAAILAAYEGLVRDAAPKARPPRRLPPPLVSAIVPYRRTPDHLLEALHSLEEQTHPALEIIVVDDGSFDPRDGVLQDAAKLPRVRVLHRVNGGLGAARNTGLLASTGRYLFPLDADNVAEPTFVARAVALLEEQPELAYVTCWSRYVDEAGDDLDADHVTGYQPLGNFDALVEDVNIAGDAASVWPRRLFDLGFRYTEDVPAVEDWLLYRQFFRAGHIGHVIPERLMRYRVRGDSMYRSIMEDQHLARIQSEASTRLKIMETSWTPQNA